MASQPARRMVVTLGATRVASSLGTGSKRHEQLVASAIVAAAEVSRTGVHVDDASVLRFTPRGRTRGLDRDGTGLRVSRGASHQYRCGARADACARRGSW